MAEESLKYRISLEDLFSKGIHGAEQSAHHFENRLGSVSESIVRLREEVGLALFAFGSFEGLKDMAEKFLEAEKAGALLKVTVGQRGGLPEDFKELTEQSEKLGKSSFFNHVEIKNAANQLLNYGISIKQTKESLQALTDAGLTKNKSLQEVISAAGMAAAGGRAMALKEYGLGFLNLEKDMSHAGAEARNFHKIVQAMQKTFAGSAEELKNTEFFKIKKLQDEFEEFKETVGKELMKGFDMILPSLRQGIHYLEEFGHWIKDNSDWLKAMAVGIAAAASAIYLFNAGMAVAAAVSEAYAVIQSVQIIAAITETTAAQLALNAAMSINPIMASIAAIGILAGAWYEATEAYQVYEDASNKNVREGLEEESRIVSNLATEWEKKGKSQKEAQEIATKAEIANIEALREQAYDLRNKSQYTNSKDYVAAAQMITKYEAILSQLRKNGIKFEEVKTNKDVNELGSGINEPKASKIQNITINVPYALQNMKIQAANIEGALEDIGPKITEFLVSLVKDSVTVASE